MKQLCIYLTFTFILSGLISGQERDLYPLQVHVNHIGPSENQLTLDFDIRIEGAFISSERQLKLTPVLSDSTSGHRLVLPEVFINGRLRNKLYHRMESLHGTGDDHYQVITADGQANVQIPYKQSVAYERWMYTASLSLDAELCGCGGFPEEHFFVPIARRLHFPESPVFDFTYTPHLTFIEPGKEEIKKRQEAGTAYILFRQGQAVILPDLSGNRLELEKIINSIEYIRSEPTARIASILIRAYASPEGTYQSNLTLSARRADAMRRYVIIQAGIPARLVSAEGMGEDWAMLDTLVSSNGEIPQKAPVLEIIRGTGIFDGRERKLMDLSGGIPYKYMLDNLFPKLRRSDYRIEYTVPEFSIEKGKELLRTRPGLLSLNELFLIAGTYTPGSEEYTEVFELAAKIYPQEKTASLNAAAAYLLIGDTERAGKILDKYTADPDAWNNLGVLLMSRWKPDEAEDALNRALEQGSADAARNLGILPGLKKAIEDYQTAKIQYERYTE